MHHHHGEDHDGPGTGPGRVLRWPRRYDLVVSVTLAGRGGRLRARIAELLQLRPGQRVLDLGCGTGTLAVALAGRTGPGGQVTGVDPAPEMVRAARAKAAGRRVPAQFAVAAGQALPFPDAAFDAVVSTLVLHHVPPDARPAVVGELVRVVRPGGRLVLVDFRPPDGRLARGATQRVLGHAMGSSDLGALRELVTAAGLDEFRLDPTPVGWLGAVHGRTPVTTVDR